MLIMMTLLGTWKRYVILIPSKLQKKRKTKRNEKIFSTFIFIFFSIFTLFINNMINDNMLDVM